MKVSGAGSSSAASGGARRVEKSNGSKGEFKKALVEAMDQSSGPSEVESMTSIAGIDALLLIQSVDDATEREARRRMVRRGEDLLDSLEELRLGLLLGTVPGKTLSDLADKVRSTRENCNDPRLAAVLDAIELRAEVELAKLSRGN